MLENRRRATGIAALSLTAVGAVMGMDASAGVTDKNPRPSAEGGGWLTAGVHFALQAGRNQAGDFGHLNIKLDGSEAGFRGDVLSLEVLSPSHARIEGVVRKAEGAYEGCEGEPFTATIQDGEQAQAKDTLAGACDANVQFGGTVEQGNLRIDGGVKTPE